MALVSRIATESPTSPREVRPEVPRALAAVVLHCLAKDPRASAGELSRSARSVLEPLSSTVKTPAPLGIRFAACVIRYLFLDPPADKHPAGNRLVRFLRGHRRCSARSPSVDTLVAVAYFAITESVWGASLGKALCGFRVVTESGARPRFARALLRALVFVPAPVVGCPAWSCRSPVSHIQCSGAAVHGLSSSLRSSSVRCFLRQRAGRMDLQAIHEWASHTRTVLKSAVEVHGLVQPAPSPIEVPASPQWVGPYRIVDTSSSQPNCGAALGYDERLRRTVWLRFPAVDADPVPHVRRTLRRPTRPRWLAGQRTSGLAWDAYEQVPGQPFDTLVTRAQSWETVRGWLCDLAEEVQAGLRDGSLPVIEFDRVWIGNDGRARLLDWPVPSDRPDSGGLTTASASGRFASRLNVSCIGLRCPPSKGMFSPTLTLMFVRRECRFQCRRPIASRSLANSGSRTSEEMLTALMSAARGPAADLTHEARGAPVAVRHPDDPHARLRFCSPCTRLFVLPRTDTATPRHRRARSLFESARSDGKSWRSVNEPSVSCARNSTSPDGIAT